MKTNIYYTIVIMAVTNLLLVSCTKENIEIKNQTYEPNQREATLTYNDILSFKSKVTEFKSGQHFKSLEKMSVTDMIWNYNAVVNFDHSFVDDPYQNFIYDSAFISIGVDEQDSVSINDAIASYIELEKELESLLSEAPFTDKAIKFSFINISSINEDGITLKAETTIGNLGNKPKPPFVTGDDWIYGNNLGKCDGTPYYEDAADKICQAVNTYRYMHINDQGKIVFYVNPVNIFINSDYITDVNNSDLFDLTNGLDYDNYRDYRLFYACDQNDTISEVFCMQHNEMNFYYEQLEQLVYNIIPYKPQNWPEVYGKVFVNVYTLDGRYGENQGHLYFVQEPTITFAKRFVIEH